ncbi:MAG: BlaI/MecI/CopY family transcriptional regulator [Clostridiales bacterium]|nr:BlaI/MecI/CopY family transcriptional regulator [Clostridiales bacterium]
MAKAEVNLTPNEWDIMKIIWDKQPCTLRQICDEANKDHDWTRHAVISFLKKMEAKGAIKVKDADPVKIYSAVIAEDEAIKKELGSTLTRVFDNSPVKMVSYLAKTGSISDEQLEQMLAILNEEDGSDGK